ncbi:MAG: hypothetical protein QXD43_05270, partial [Candidatus Aenigmatarchaeota archaeon]
MKWLIFILILIIILIVWCIQNVFTISLIVSLPKDSYKVGEYLNGSITLKDYSNKSAYFILITNGKKDTNIKCYYMWCCGNSVTMSLVSRNLSNCVNSRFTSPGVYTFEVNVYDCTQYHKATGKICNPLYTPKNFQEWAANISNQLTPIASVKKLVVVTENTTCIPQTCQQLGYSCGEHNDGCNRKIYCGSCPMGYICNTSGQCSASIRVGRELLIISSGCDNRGNGFFVLMNNDTDILDTAKLSWFLNDKPMIAPVCIPTVLYTKEE